MKFVEDTSAFLEDFGAEVVFGTITAKAMFDKPDGQIFDGRYINTDYSITFATKSLCELQSGSEIKVDGEKFKVREVFKIDDGVFSKATLSNI